MGGRPPAGIIVVRHLGKLVYTPHDNHFVHRVRSDRIEFCRTVGLRGEYWSFATCLNHLGRILDLAVGPRWSGTFNSHDGVFSGDRATCSAS